MEAVAIDKNFITVDYFPTLCSVPVRLNGFHQINNACTSLLALSKLQILDTRFSFNPENILKGMENVRWAGRLEKLKFRNYDIYVDGAHNMAGAQRLQEFVQTFKTNVTWIVGFSQHKDIYGILQCLLQDNDTVMSMEFDSPENMPWVKCASHEQIENHVQNLAVNTNFFRVDSFDDAIRCIDVNSTIVVCGSLYLISQVYKNFNKSPKK